MSDDNGKLSGAEDRRAEGDEVLNRYEECIGYYWNASRRNKNAYKLVRYLTIAFGALVTSPRR